jgi:hypothetical protein
MSDFFDEELEENSNSSLLLADIDWTPQNDPFDISVDSFALNIVNRLSGIDEDKFKDEVVMWQTVIENLPNYSEAKLKNEMNNWDFSIPIHNDFSFETLSIAYARMVQYRTYLVKWIDVVNAHHEILSNAHKSLKEMAVKLANGPKHDKDAIATFTVQPFLHKVTVAKRCLMYLENIQKNIDFGAVQLERLMRERQNLARINQNFNNEGLSNIYSSAVENQTSNGMIRKADEAGIRTRNNRI